MGSIGEKVVRGFLNVPVLAVSFGAVVIIIYGSLFPGSLKSRAADDRSVTVPPALFVKASQHGLVQVIVTVRVPTVPDDRRAQAITTAVEAVLTEIAGTPHRVVRRYQTVPVVALEASTATLRVLAASAVVAAVQENALSAPQ